MGQKTTNFVELGPQSPHATKRYDYLDNIKWTLSILVILHHAAAIAGLDPFPVNYPLVDISERYQYSILSSFQSVNQGYFMSLFFFISAYFVMPSYNRKGPIRFLKDKFVRLGIPLVLTIILIDPLALYLSNDLPFIASIQNVLHQYGQQLQSLNIIMGVTWFCWSLIVFNLFYVLFKISGRVQTPTKQKTGPLPSIPVMVLFSTAMIPFCYLGFYLMDLLGKDFLGFHLLKYFPMYIAMFCLGIQAQKRKWIDQLTYRHVFVWFALWLAARIFLNPLSQMLSRPFEVIGMSIIMLYSFKTLFNSKNQWSKRLSRSAYAAYVLQILPLCIIGKLLLPYMTKYPVANFLMVGFPSVIISFAIAHYICKLPLLNRVF